MFNHENCPVKYYLMVIVFFFSLGLFCLIEVKQKVSLCKQQRFVI